MFQKQFSRVPRAHEEAQDRQGTRKREGQFDLTQLCGRFLPSADDEDRRRQRWEEGDEEAAASGTPRPRRIGESSERESGVSQASLTLASG